MLTKKKHFNNFESFFPTTDDLIETFDLIFKTEVKILEINTE
jgi:hypothetical protein